MMKRKITKAEHTALKPELQAEYSAEGEDFVLQAEGFDDPGELRRALDREKEEKKAALAKVGTLEAKVATITDTDARRSGDIATLEKSWQAKVDAAKTEGEVKAKKLETFVHTSLVDSVATQLSSDLAGENATILLPHLRNRLQADLTGDVPLTRVLDKEGKLSALSVEDLKKEIATDVRFKAIIVASRASGGGAAGGGNGNRPGGGAPGTKKFAELNDKERTDWWKADPAGFEAAAKAHKEEFLASASSPARA